MPTLLKEKPDLGAEFAAEESLLPDLGAEFAEEEAVQPLPAPAPKLAVAEVQQPDLGAEFAQEDAQQAVAKAKTPASLWQRAKEFAKRTAISTLPETAGMKREDFGWFTRNVLAPVSRGAQKYLPSAIRGIPKGVETLGSMGIAIPAEWVAKKLDVDPKHRPFYLSGLLEDEIRDITSISEEFLKRTQFFEKAPAKDFSEFIKDPERIVSAVAESLPYMAGTIAATAAGGPLGGLGFAYSVASDQARQEALQNGASDTEANIAGHAIGAVVAAIEVMQASLVLKFVGQGAKASFVSNTIRRLLINRNLGRFAESGVVKFLSLGLSEAVEEGLQQTTEELGAAAIYGKEIAGGVWGFLNRMAIAMTTGGLMGLGLGGAGKVGARVVEGKAAPAVTPEPPPIQETQRAQEIREAPGQVPEAGIVPAARQVEGREDVQQPEEARPEARVAEPQEEVDRLAEAGWKIDPQTGEVIPISGREGKKWAHPLYGFQPRAPGTLIAAPTTGQIFEDGEPTDWVQDKDTGETRKARRADREQPGWEPAKREANTGFLRRSGWKEPGEPGYEERGTPVARRKEPAKPVARTIEDFAAQQPEAQIAETKEAAQPTEVAEPIPTSIKLEAVAEARVKRKLEPVPAPTAESQQQWIAEARVLIEKDPALPARLIAEQTESPRALKPVEVATLQVHRRTVSTAYESATDRFFAADKAGDATAKEEARRAVEVYESELQAMEEASKAAGAQWARSGVARQLALKQDYSLAGMVRRARVANDGKPLSTKVRARIRRQAARIAELQKKIDQKDFARPKKRKPAPLTGEALRLQHELDRTKAEYQRGVFQLKLKNRSLPLKIVGGVGEVFNVARALMTSFDLSAVLRQGGFGAIGHPIRAAKSFPAMIRALLSEKRRFAVEHAIHNRPNAKLYKSSGLYLSRRGGALSEMEEAYMSRWAEKIPGVAASERAYTTFLDKFRVESFDAMVKTLGRNGEVTTREAEAIANFINVSTGRGSLGVRANAHTVLNTVFFAPRLVASRFQLLGAQPLYGGTARTRAMIAMEYARFLAGIGLIYGLTSLVPDEWDWSVEFDPRSADFGKIKIGNTRLDLLAGLSQVTVFAARIVTGKTKTQRGELVPIRGKDVPYGYGTGADVLARFLRSKLSPMSGTFVNIFAGKDYIGEPVTIGTTVTNITIPMAMRDIYDAMRDMGVSRGAAIGLLAIFGVGMQTYATKRKRRKSQRRK